MAFTVRIKKPNTNTWQVINSCIEDSLRIESILGQTIDTLSLRIMDQGNLDIVNLSDIEVYDKYSEYNPTINHKVFAGIITLIKETIPNMKRIYDISAQDYTMLLNTSYVYANFAITFDYKPDYYPETLKGDIARIAWAFDNADWGTLGEHNREIDAITYVDAKHESPFYGANMRADSFNLVSLTEFMNTMCSYNGFNYYVDFDKKLHYYKRSSEASPYVLDDNAVKQPSNNTIPYRSIQLKRDANNVRNQFVLWGDRIRSDMQHREFEVTADNSEQVIENGLQAIQVSLSSLSIGRNINMISVIPNKHISITRKRTGEADLVFQDDEIGTAGIDELGDDIHALHQSVQQYVIFETNSNYSVQIGDTLVFEYTFLFTYGQYDENPLSVNKYGRKYCKILQAPDSNSIAAIGDKVRIYKEQFSYELETIYLTIDSFCPYSDQLEVGQWIRVINHNIGSHKVGNTEVKGLDGYYNIYRISTSILGGSYAEKEIELRSWYTENGV